MDHAEKGVRGYLCTICTNARRDQSVDRQGIDCCIGINHEQVLVERGVDSNNVFDLVVHLQLEWIHRCVEVDLGSN